MSAPKKAAPKKASHPSYKLMAMEAIAHTRHAGKGASRAAIANYIQSTYKIEGGGMFNAALRRALMSGCAAGVFAHGDSAQRFKLTDAGRKVRNDANKPKPKKKKKKVVKKKKTTKKKKKTTKKKKKTTKKKKVVKKKKTTTKKKKAAPKRKAGSKKKAAPKRKPASKGKKKKTTTKKRASKKSKK